MEKDISYSLELSTKTRNLGLVMSLILVPTVLVFSYIDHVSPPLGGIFGWRIGALVPAFFFLSYALFVFPKHRRLVVPLHIAQLTGLIVMMCGITADLATRAEFPQFGRTALISSLIICIFVDFVFAGGARRYLFAILVPPLAAMGVFVTAAGAFLTQTEQVWLISNPAAMAIILSVLALFQDRSRAKEFHARRELKNAEDALRESETKYHDLFENAEVGMFRTRIDGSEVLDVNRRLLEFSGRTREEMIGSSPASLWADPREREEMRALLTRDGRVTNFECRLLDARGEVRTCLLSSKASAEREVLEGSIVDITEHKRAGQWMEVLRHSIDAAADGAYWMREDGGFFYANDSGCRALAYTREELMLLNITDVNPHSTRESWAAVWRSLREKGSFTAETFHRRKDGSQFPVELTTSFVRFGDQEFSVGFAHDITERKRLEAERESVWQRLEFIIATTQTGLDIIDENFIVRYVDPARRKLMGDPSGRPCYEYFRGLSSPCEDCAMQRAFQTRKVQVNEQSLPNDDHRTTQVTALPYQDESGAWMVAEVIVDITERTQAEAERLELERRVASSQRLEGLGILAGGVAHNFNNLLTVILGHAELLRERLPRELDPASSVQEIIKAGYRSRDLISQLLTLGRKQVLELKPLDLNVIVRGCSAMLRQAIRENIEIDYRLSTSPCPVAADPGRMEEILLNLALNAQDAIPREGRISISTSEASLEGMFARRHDDVPAGRCVLLSIGDTGAGMNEKTIGRIFEPFFTTKEQGKGTGLGLSTVYGIVKQHHGSIKVESTPGAGSRFMIYLPCSMASQDEDDPGHREPPAQGSETILLVEDEAPIRTLLSHNLRSLGYAVVEAVDGLSALQVAAEHGGPFHILVTDVVMPRMNGTELHDRLRERMPRLKVLFMSGYQRDVISSHVVQAGELDLITKPFTGPALAARVREILDRS
ncbi:MAG: PAS domain S-box protein [Spirochaetia bacterium]|jgi:PAS domain S-box-containing protein